jgi:hypothetical protein
MSLKPFPSDPIEASCNLEFKFCPRTMAGAAARAEAAAPALSRDRRVVMKKRKRCNEETVQTESPAFAGNKRGASDTLMRFCRRPRDDVE